LICLVAGVITSMMRDRNPNVFEMNPVLDLEERLANTLADFGPFVCLGRQLEAYGSSRIIVSEEKWKEKALFLIRTAKIIFMVPGYQDGTIWEMKQIVNYRYLYKTVFIVPIGDNIGGLTAKKHWKKTEGVWKDSLGIILPTYKREQLFTISESGTAIDLFWLGEMSKPERVNMMFRQIEFSNSDRSHEGSIDTKKCKERGSNKPHGRRPPEKPGQAGHGDTPLA